MKQGGNVRYKVNNEWGKFDNMGENSTDGMNNEGKTSRRT